MKKKWKIIHIKTNTNIYIKEDGVWHQGKPKYYNTLKELQKDVLLNKEYFERLKDSYAVVEEKTYSRQYYIDEALGQLVLCDCCEEYKPVNRSYIHKDGGTGICFDCY